MAGNVVVTGAGRGLGAAVVDTLVERGWTVWATDIDGAGLTASRAQHTALLDVGDESAVIDFFGDVHRAGGVAALVNNAGVFPLRAWDRHDLGFWRQVLDVNVLGTYVCSREAARSMIETGAGGSIVNVASLTFFKGHPTGLAYSASKGAVIGLTRSMARALGPNSIRVNAVGPGLMATGGTLELVARGDLSADRFDGDDPDRQLPGVTQPDGVADTIAFLLGEDAREVTGQVLVADGGSIFN